MNPDHQPVTRAPGAASDPPAEMALSKLVAEVYEAAPLALRSRLLEQLMRPLGVLALVAVANGIFAKIRFRSSWPELQIRAEDAQGVQASDVMALVDRVQQVSVESVDGLAKLLIASPMMTGSATAALLVTLLMQRARTRRTGDVRSGGARAPRTIGVKLAKPIGSRPLPLRPAG